MTRKRWFLPETPDVLGMLRRQMAVTIDGMDAFARWAGGDAAAAEAVRDAEHRGDAAKRELLSALREAFVTPLEPEDLFALSRGIDRILNYAADLVDESEVMACPPDAGIATMAGLLGDALRHLDDALSTARDRRRPRDRVRGRRHRRPAPARDRLLRRDGGAARASRTARSGSRAASCTAAARGSARPWSTSPSASSTPSSSRAERASSAA